MELKSTRYEIADRVATVWLHRPHRHNAWTGRMHTEYRSVMAELDADPHVRAIVVTGTPPAFCVGGDSDALAEHAERGGYDEGLPAAPAQPGYGVRAELDHDFAWHYGLRLPVIAAVNGACAGVGLALALFCDLRFVVRFSANDDGRSKTRLTGRIRNELGATPARRSDPSRRPPPVGARLHGPRDGVVGLVERRPRNWGGDARGRPWVRPQPDRTGIAQLCDRDQAAALRRPAPPRRGRSSRGLEIVAPLHDGCRRLPGGRRRAARAPRPRWP